ncbi:MAG: filamentous hemagglutinin N-terminal domain-containing protein, partial [Hydrococcus sp. Prado102]|nr:filamentous hemagglutinin N-terminal domain-containing protein [Hydrococcus sp. Prado102]
MKKITSKTLIFIVTFMPFVVSDRQSQAQISSDGTLPTNVRRSGNAFEITGGSQAGGNLFHSFKEFSVPRGGEAFFKNATNASNVDNIISRVTGGSISNIDGLIRENYGANFILINPNGINFGANARLQIGGSFLASTSDSLKFADGTVFSATNPQAEPLLTVSVPVGLQFGQNPTPIRVQNTGHNLSFGDDGRPPIERPNPLPAGLSVSAGQTLALVGGNLTFDGGIVRTGELGTIELGSVGQGQVSLNSVSNSPGWRLGYEGMSSFGNIQFNAASLVDASGIVGGSIRLQGAQIEIAEGSAVLLQNLGNVNAGEIEINASESLELRGVSPENRGFISTVSTEAFGSGKGGSVTITAPKLAIADGGRVGTSTFGSGDGGELNVVAQESVFVNGSSPAIPGNFTTLGTLSINEGNSGNFSLSTTNLTVSNGAIVGALAFGQGDAGNLRIDASNSILIRGVAPDFPSSVGSFSNSAGDAGDAIVNTRQLIARDGGRLITATFGSGGGGNLTLNASESVSIIGEAPGFSSVVGSFSSSAGEAGNTTVTTKQAVIRNGGGLVSATFGAGNGGDLTLNASESVEVSGIGVTNSSRSIISAGAIGLFDQDPLPSGDAGHLTINSERVSLSRDAQITTANLGRGDAGNIRINAGSIFLSDRAGITAVTLPNIGGRGGSIALQARNSIQAHNNSQISNINGGAQAAGNLTLETGRLIFSDGSFAATTTLGQGAGGNLIVRASESVELAGDGFEAYQETINRFLTGANDISDISNGLFTGSNSAGRAGNLTIKTPQLNLREGAIVSTSTFGTGKGGDIIIKADRGVDLSGSGIASTTSTNSPAGRVTIDTSKLMLRDGGAIVTATLGDGRGGDLIVNASEFVELSNTPVTAITPTGMFTNSVNGKGRAGDLTINTQRLDVRDGSGISTQSGGLIGNSASLTGGNGGNLSINATEEIELVGFSSDGRFISTLSTSTFTASPAGNIDITTGKLSVRDGAILGASTFAGGTAGNVNIDASEFVEVTGTAPRSALPLPGGQSLNPSTIASSANLVDGRLFGRFSLPSGKSGNVTINTDRLRVSDGALITTSNDGRGLSGNIKLDARSIILNNTGAITAELGGTNRGGRPIFFSPATVGGNRGGKIEISTQQLTLQNAREISTSTFT